MNQATPYFDQAGNRLSRKQLATLLRKNSTPQFGWWKAKVQPKWGQGRPPRGVRTSKLISRL